MRLDSQYFSGYGLSLSDGSNWWMTADETKSPWLDEMAAIMKLEKCAANGFQKIIFSSNSDIQWWENEHTGWSSYGDQMAQIWHHPDISDVIYEFLSRNRPGAKYPTMWRALQPIYLRSMSQGGMPFHAGCAELDGKAVLFAGPGNVGKSTCCRRIPDYWKPLCDDEVLIALDDKNEYRIHPFPTWSDYLWEREKNTWDVQYSVPLAGIFLLEQSEIDEVDYPGMGDAAFLIYESATQICQRFWEGEDTEYHQNFRKKLFDNACEIVKQVPVFNLRVSLHGKFWEKVEGVVGY